jgi:hypothetical protein
MPGRPPWKADVNVLLQDLVKRSFGDSGKTNKDYRPLSEFLRRSWTEIAGGANCTPYMKPLCMVCISSYRRVGKFGE